MDSHTAAVIGLAWARGLGADDDAFTDRGARATVIDDSLETLEHVELFGAEVLRGPGRLVERVATLPAAAFRDGAALAGLTTAPGGGGLRTTQQDFLAYRDHYSVERPPASAPPAGAPIPALGQVPTISHAPDDAALVLDACPADDAADAPVRISLPGTSLPGTSEPGYPSTTTAPETPAEGPPTLFTLVEDDARVALAGFHPQHHLLADVRVVTASSCRRRGHATTVATLAIEDALDAGLICQARLRDESAAAKTLAERLGFAHAGSRVVFGPGRAYDR